MTREEAVDYLKWIRPKNPYTQDKKNVQTAIDMAIEALKETERNPTVTSYCAYRVEARPHGEWIYHKHDKVFECSECHYHFDEDEFGLEIPQVNATWVKVCVYNFCPNCGADLRVKDELNRVNKELNSEIVKSKSEIVPDYRDGWRLKDTHAEYWDNLGIAKEGGANDRERMGEDGL